MAKLFIGIDVQIQRGVPVAVMDDSGVVLETFWFDSFKAADGLATLVTRHGSGNCFVGIDAPRQPMPAPRTWSCVRGVWRQVEGNRGRHCELVIKNLGLANPQWTPLVSEAPGWMRLGFELFEAADKAGALTFEVFPSATYKALANASGVESVTISLSGMLPGPKDMLDAIVGAFTVWRFVCGKGCSVGGGDGLGEIILPTVLAKNEPVHRWPG